MHNTTTTTPPHLRVEANQAVLADERDALHGRRRERPRALLRGNLPQVLAEHPDGEAAALQVPRHDHGVDAQRLAMSTVLVHRVVRQPRAAEARAVDEADHDAARARDHEVGARVRDAVANLVQCCRLVRGKSYAPRVVRVRLPTQTPMQHNTDTNTEIHAQARAHTHAHTHIHAHTCTYTHKRIHRSTETQARTHTNTHTHKHT